MKKTTILGCIIWITMMMNCKTVATPGEKNEPEKPIVVVDSYEDMRTAYLGKFTYFADAALFEDCGSENKFTILPKADIYDGSAVYLELEKHYREQASEPGKPIYIEIEGNLVEKPIGEEGPSFILVPDRFLGVSKGYANCK